MLSALKEILSCLSRMKEKKPICLKPGIHINNISGFYLVSNLSLTNLGNKYLEPLPGLDIPSF